MITNDSNEVKKYVPPMFAGAGAGVVARLFTHPLDTCKAKLQIHYGTSFAENAPFRNTASTLLYTVRKEGIAGLYRGIGISVVGAIPAACTYFTCYEISKKMMIDSHPVFTNNAYLAHLFAGLIAETTSCCFWVPIDVVKERLQVQSNYTGLRSRYNGSWHALKTILKEEGIVGPYRGYGATVASFGPFSALYFMFYEKIKAWAIKHQQSPVETKNKNIEDLNFVQYLGCAATAGALASFLTNPIDLAKLRLQVQRGSKDNSHGFHYRHSIHAMKEITVHEGFFTLFRGAGARVAFHAPSTAISLALFETFRKNIEVLLVK